MSEDLFEKCRHPRTPANTYQSGTYKFCRCCTLARTATKRNSSASRIRILRRAKAVNP